MMRMNVPTSGRVCSLFLALSVSRALFAAAPDPGPGRVLHLRLHSDPVAGAYKPGASGSVPTSVSVRTGKRTPMAGAGQRSSELSSHQIVVVGLDDKAREVWRSVQIDPRLLRSEGQSTSGASPSGQTSYRNDVEFAVTPPEALHIRQLRIYKPRWTGAEFELDLISEAPVEGF
jgi:hypothetical protein